MTKPKTAPPKAPKAPKAASPTPTAASVPAGETKPDELEVVTAAAASTEALPEFTAADGTRVILANLPLVTRLDHARNLPEVAPDVKSKPASDKLTAIQSFKGEDRRTMNVVLVEGALAQQEVVS